MSVITNSSVDSVATNDQVRDLYAAVAERFKKIKDGFTKVNEYDPVSNPHGDAVYHGRRTSPEELGWRMRQMVCGGLGFISASRAIELTAQVESGAMDSYIHSAWLEAAKSEYWYSNEKEWHRA